MDNYYGMSRDGCKACNCNVDGSRTLQCDQTTGACNCQPNIGGQHCDRCQENKYNLAAGCLDCPVCYNVVQEQVNILRRQINELREIIIHIGGSDRPPIDDADFKRQLTLVNITVVRLWNDAKRFSGFDSSLGGQLDVIRAAIDEIMSTCGQVTSDIVDTSRGAQTAVIDVAAAERAVDNAERALQDAERLLKTDGANALKQAIDAQKQFGQQSDRMTDISREAREYADRQVIESTNIDETAKEALNTSEEAYRIAQSAFQKPGLVTAQIDIIIRSVVDVERLYNTTKRAAQTAQDQAQEAYRDALSNHTQADSIRITTVNVDSLTQDSNQIKSEAGDIKQQADQLISQHESLMTDVERQMKEAVDFLEDGNRQQQITDELLADADAARDMARKAVSKAENTLREANDTLRILKEFNRTVSESRQKADEALKQIPEIERMIDDAEQKTQEARGNLAGAERDAEQARDIAEQAQSVAADADMESRVIRNKTTIISVQATTIKRHSEQLNVDIDAIDRRLRELEQQAEEDENLARDALEKADQARTSANSATSKVSGALSTVSQILSQLASLDSIDTAKLDELEVNLTSAHRKLTDAQIDSRYSELEELSTQMTQWIYDYSTQLTELTRDVENIRVINITIPRTCFREINLEPVETATKARITRL
jgi:laminin gamma 1